MELVVLTGLGVCGGNGGIRGSTLQICPCLCSHQRSASCLTAAISLSGLPTLAKSATGPHLRVPLGSESTL